MKTCFNCGARIDDDSLFCTECGKPIPQGSVCPHCGASVNEGDVFCQNCGKRIDESSSTEITDSPSESPEGITENSNYNKKKIIPIVLGMIAFALIGGWWFLNSSKDKGTADSGVGLTESIDEADSSMVNSSSSDGFFHDFNNGEMNHHLIGTFTDMSGSYPVEINFSNIGSKVSNVIYKNISVGGKISMTCKEFNDNIIIFEGKDGNNRFEISLKNLNENTFEGTAIVGDKDFVVNMKANCSHDDSNEQDNMDGINSKQGIYIDADSIEEYVDSIFEPTVPE